MADLKTKNNIMYPTIFLTGRFRFVSCSVLLAVLTGCVGFVGPGYVDAYVPGPDVVVFGGYGRGGFDRDFGRRGAESRRSFGHSERSGGRGGGRR